MKTKEVTISEDTYTLTQLQTGEMIYVHARAANIAAAIMPSGMLQEMAGTVAKQNMFQVFLEACKDPRLAEHILFFSKIFAKVTTLDVESKDVPLAKIFELHFAGKPRELLQWIWESIAFNMGDGFLDLFRKSADIGAKIPEVSKSP